MSIKIVVASKNPVKLKAVEMGFKKMFEKNPEIIGISVPSNVSDQPMSDEETQRGAFNRAKNAKNENPDADYWVGLEGGVEEENGDLHAFAWMTVIDKKGKIGKGKTGTFILPKKVADLIIKEGKELGEADDIVFNKKNSKQDNGAIGILTGDVLTRASFYADAMVLALIPFKNEKLY